MNTNGRTINLVMILIVILFLTIGFGGMAMYGVFNRDNQTAVSPAPSPTATRFAAMPSATPAPATRPSATAPSPGTRGCNGTPVISSFIANPTTIRPGQSSTLSWGLVSNANAAEIDNGIGGVATPGGISVSPKTTTTYTLTARCGQNVVQSKVTVVVQ